jgi:hypothetical protein
MRTCTNCGNTITCGCQDRIASDGKKVCSNCLAIYEQQLKDEALRAASTPKYYSSDPNENITS